jgi:branched-chain amino acid transport system ATP-binding protein
LYLLILFSSCKPCHGAQEQNINIAPDYAQYAFVLENGRMDEGSAAELAAREDLHTYSQGAVG